MVCVLAAVVLFVVINMLIIKFNGKPVPAPTIPRGPQQLGEGRKLTYVVMGDSTAIAQGAPYKDGYAVASAKHLAAAHAVTFVNVGVSGAVANDVAGPQLTEALRYKPDIVLIAVGANDVTHFTSGSAVEQAMQQTIDGLRQANPAVKIIVTGSPAMDTVPRFPWAAQRIALWRVHSVNAVFERLVAKNHLVFAPIATETRAAFKADPTLFAQDKFHPNARGYALWTPVITRALDEAVRQ